MMNWFGSLTEEPLLSTAQSQPASRRVRISVFFSLFIAGVASANPILAPFTLDLGGLAGNFNVMGTTLASGLNYPYGMSFAPNGSLQFGSSVPQTPFGIEGGPSVGSVWMLPAQAGGTFGAPQQVSGSLGGAVTDVRTTPNGITLVDSGAASGRQMTFFNQSFQQIGVLNFNYPTQNWDHSTGMSAAVQQPMDRCGSTLSSAPRPIRQKPTSR
jgi:hypothetical protein